MDTDAVARRFDLTGKVAVVTGGSRGIGRALVMGFAEAGADVVIASRKLDNCVAVAQEVTERTGRRALGVACHVAHWDDCDRLCDTVYDELGRCDVLVNNAGMSPLYEKLDDVSREYYEKVHGVNAAGPFRLSVRFGDRMAAAGGGAIINVTTAGSYRPDWSDLPYAMAKAGLNAMTLGLAGAWNPHVRVNLLVPGAFETDITKAWAPGTVDQVNATNPMRRIGQPQDMVGAALLLASDAGSYINGAQILVDGGLFRSL